MYRVTFRLARAGAAAFSASLLLSGCVAMGNSGPLALGAGMPRSIKDDPEPAVAAPASKPAPAVKSAALPTPRQPAPPVTRKRTDVPTCATGSECMVRLKAMVASPSRSWVGQPQTPLEYANGTRLFAYRALRSQLTCEELGKALKDVAAAATSFRAPVKGLSAAQASRVLTLNTEVERELQSESAQRCKS